MSKVDSWAAFPVTSASGGVHSGMSMRDYFAAKAMQGMISAREPIVHIVDFEAISIDAYRIADAMLKTRAA